MSVNAILDGSEFEQVGQAVSQAPTADVPAECPQAGLSAVEGEAAGVCLCNTHPSGSQFEIEDYPDYHFAGGHDWLEWGIHVQWGEERFRTLPQNL